MQPHDLLFHSGEFVLSSWWHPITPLLDGFRSIQVPHSVRLLPRIGQPGNCKGFLGTSRDERKAALCDALRQEGKWVCPPSHTGVLASVRQTVSGQTLQVCLAAREDWVGLATLNQKALVYQDGLIEGSPLHRLSPLPGAIAFEADGSTTHHQMPAGILDFGFEVSMDDIPLFSSEGAGFGKGLVFGMFNCEEDHFLSSFAPRP